MTAFQLLFGALLLLGTSNAHDYARGKCPQVTPMANLDVDRFLGEWYAIQQYDTDSHCVKLTYKRKSESELTVTKTRQVLVGLLDRLGVEHTNTYTGTLDFPSDQLSRMRVKWPANLAGKGDYIVFDTDYETYAGIYECQNIKLFGLFPQFHRKSAAILSRRPTLAGSIISQLRSTLRSFGVPLKHLDIIPHERCVTTEEADININLGPDTFTTAVENTRTGIEDVATTIAQGVRDVFSTIQSTITNTPVVTVATDTGIDSAFGPAAGPGIEGVDGGIEDPTSNGREPIDETSFANRPNVDRVEGSPGDGPKIIDDVFNTGIAADRDGPLADPFNPGIPFSEDGPVDGIFRAGIPENADNFPPNVEDPTLTPGENVDVDLRNFGIGPRVPPAEPPLDIGVSLDEANKNLGEEGIDLGPSFKNVVNGVDERVNEVDGPQNELDKNYYNVVNPEAPVDEIIKTVVSIDKRRK